MANRGGIRVRDERHEYPPDRLDARHRERIQAQGRLMALKRLPDGRIPVLLSAHADELVAVDAQAIADYLDRFPETTVADVALQLGRTRRVRRYRAVLRAAGRLELIDGLRALAAGRAHPPG